MHWCAEPAGGEQKSADVEQKTVTLIYPYPKMSQLLSTAFFPSNLVCANKEATYKSFNTLKAYLHVSPILH